MTLDFLNALGTQPVAGLTLDQGVYQVYTTGSPPIWRYLIQLHLFGQNFFPDFLPIGTSIGPFTSHKLVCHNTQGKEVNRVGMALFGYNFRSHVARRATGVFSIVCLYLP